MNMNWYEINSQSHSIIEQRRQEAEVYRMFKTTTEGAKQEGKQNSELFQVLRRLIARLRVVSGLPITEERHNAA